MLEVRGLIVSYGGIKAVQGVSFDVAEGQIVAMVGPNGAGKSTTLWTLVGDLRAEAGSVRFKGDELLGRRPEDIARRGISLVPESRGVFTSLTVEENLKIGTAVRSDRRRARQEIAELEERFPVLGEMRDRPAGRLSGGQQQQLVIARALIARPHLLLLDEPSLGLDPHTVSAVFDLLAELRDSGTTILLIEQNVAESVRLADYAYVIRGGSIALEASATDMFDDSEFAEMYLGTKGG